MITDVPWGTGRTALGPVVSIGRCAIPPKDGTAPATISLQGGLARDMFAVIVQTILPIVVIVIGAGFAAYLGARQALPDFYGAASWEDVEP